MGCTVALVGGSAPALLCLSTYDMRISFSCLADDGPMALLQEGKERGMYLQGEAFEYSGGRFLFLDRLQDH